MLKHVSVFLLLIAFAAASVPADTWTFDKAHSSIGFSVRHLVVSKTKGYFTDYNGHVKFDGKNPAEGSVEVIIQMASIDTDNADRDKHLKSADFFDVEKYPVMKFQSKKVIPGEDDTFKLIGDLTIKDVTREVTLDGEFNGMINDARGNTRAGFSAETTINRQDFNVAWDNKLQDGSLVVSNDVNIVLELELIKEK